MSIHVKTAAGWEELGISGTPGELPGLGGWAEITEVTGSPKRYAYNDGPGGVGGTDWVAFEWTQDGSLTTDAGGLMDCLVVAGGASGGAGAWSGGGAFITGIQSFGSSPLTVKVGAGATAPGKNAGWTQLGDFKPAGPTTCSSGGGQFIGYPGDNPAAGFTSSITGTSRTYSRSNRPDVRANSGDGSNGGHGGGGVVIVRVPAAQATKVPPWSWVTRSNNFAVVESGVVTETYTEHHYGDGTVSPLPQTDLIPCDANVTEGYVYENGEFVAPPAPEIPAAQQEILDRINELQKELRSYDG
jgi:hypothetical protein